MSGKLEELLSAQMDQPQVKRNRPLKRVQVLSLLQTCNRRHQFFLPEVGHADVVPELRGVGVVVRGDGVLHKGFVLVALVLN